MRKLLKLLTFILLCCVFITACTKIGEPNPEHTGPATAPAQTAERIISPEPQPTVFYSPTPYGMQELRGLLIMGEPSDVGDLVLHESELEDIVPHGEELAQNTVIVIYHTHAREAFRQSGHYSYEETEENSYRCTDLSKTVVAVGELMAEELRALGYTVIHDKSDVEEPKLGTAYTRSLGLMESYAYADVFIDLHRNAANVRLKSDDVVMIDGERCARMFFVVGTGIGDYEGEFDEKPQWRENLAHVLLLMERMRAIDPELVLDTRIKTGRYNQHVSDKCILLELGHNANTMEDALNSVKHFVKAFSEVFPREGQDLSTPES